MLALTSFLVLGVVALPALSRSRSHPQLTSSLRVSALRPELLQAMLVNACKRMNARLPTCTLASQWHSGIPLEGQIYTCVQREVRAGESRLQLRVS